MQVVVVELHVEIGIPHTVAFKEWAEQVVVEMVKDLVEHHQMVIQDVDLLAALISVVVEVVVLMDVVQEIMVVQV